MDNKISIIDKDKHIELFIMNNNIFVYSNNYPIDLNRYINHLKNISLDDFYSKSESTILYKTNNKSKKSKKKKIHIGVITYIVTLSAIALMHSALLSDYKVYYLNQNTIEISDYNPNDLYSLINSSPYLTEEEKSFLFNRDYLSDILELINKDDYLKYIYSIRFNNMRIDSFDESDDTRNLFGYYDTDYPSTLFIKNYEKLTDVKKDTVAHEFVHLTQDISGYNLLIESCAEIISNEYYNTPLSCYSIQVSLVKRLMEIIGPEPIWIYNFTGDFSLIEECVKPYLTEEEYKEFLNDLTFDYDDYEKNLPKYDSLEELLSKLYLQIYHEDINDNTVISLIKKSNRTLSRYYFNKRYINEENSYYLDFDEGSYQTLSFEEAIDKNLIQIYSIVKTPIDKDSAISLAQTGNYSIERIIDYKSADIRIIRTTQKNCKLFISGFVNGIKYEDYDIDNLVLDGTINIDYYLVNLRNLSASEYLNHDYSEDATIQILHSGDTQINEDNVYGFVPKRVYLKPTSEIFKDKDEKTL